MKTVLSHCKHLLVVSAASAGLWSGAAVAAVPTTANVEGILMSAGGGPAADGNYNVQFNLYAQQTGGTAVWTETGSVAAKAGQFTYQMGSKTPLSAAGLNLQSAWLGVTIGADAELPRQAVGSSLFALRAAVAESLDCSGCIKGTAIDGAVLQPYAKAADLGNYAKAADLSAYAKSADLGNYAKASDLAEYAKASSLAAVAASGSFNDLKDKPALADVAKTGNYGDLTGKPTLAKIGSACGTGLVLSGFKADGSLDCGPLQIPPDYIDEISNGLIWNQFVDSTPGGQKVQIPDGLGAGVSNSLTFPDIGLAQAIWVDIDLVNSDLTHITIELFGPGMSTPYVLYAKGKSGQQLKAAFNKDTAIASGDINKDWIGKNIKGTWSLTVKDPVDNQIKELVDGDFSWSLSIQTLSTKKVQVKGNLLVDGSVKVGTDSAGCTSVNVGALRYTANGMEICSGTEWKPHGRGVTYTRWGRKDCPSGSTLLWKGWAAGAHYTHGGSGGNTMCMVEDPKWPSGYQYNDGNHDNALIYGVEYESNGSVPALNDKHDYDMGCATCYAESRNVQIMVPGKPECPAGWNVEYTGYIVAEHHGHSKSEWLCIDKDMQAFGSNSNSNGRLWYLAEVECGALPCGPYVQNREVTCAVCSR